MIEHPPLVGGLCIHLPGVNELEGAPDDFFVGKREDLLRRDGDAFKIASRRIFLDQNVLLAKNLTLFF